MNAGYFREFATKACNGEVTFPDNASGAFMIHITMLGVNLETIDEKLGKLIELLEDKNV